MSMTETQELENPVEAGRRDLLIIRIGDMNCAIPVENLATVLPARRPTRIPRLPGHVAGLINHRGEILPVLDIRVCLRLSDETPSDPQSLLILKTAGTRVGILSDSRGELEPIPNRDIRTLDTAETTGFCAAEFVRHGRMVGLLDVDRIVESFRATQDE